LLLCQWVDPLPHNGAVITLSGFCERTHRQSHLGLCVVAVAVPVLALVSVVALGSLFGRFWRSDGARPAEAALQGQALVSPLRSAVPHHPPPRELIHGRIA